ncbi:MAG: hypothetical protein HJJLKODD_00100 [Phycisphaerae bacterium]|nr:hypothetical protein [Phycisphaerae bacterium]
MLICLLVLIGLLTGILGAMLGLGGSIVLIPALNLAFGPRQHLHQAAAMIINFFVVLPATWQHFRAGVVYGRLIRVALPITVVAVLAGVQLSEAQIFSGTQQKYLTAIFGVFILLDMLYQLVRYWQNRPLPQISEEGLAALNCWRAGLIIGVPTGLIGGLLGVGGGLVAIPLQQIILRFPLRLAIGNSVAVICGTSVVGAVFKNIHWYRDATDSWALADQPLTLAGVLIIPAVIGSLIGSRLTHILPIRVVRLSLIVVLTLAGVRQIAYLWG